MRCGGCMETPHGDPWVWPGAECMETPRCMGCHIFTLAHSWMIEDITEHTRLKSRRTVPIIVYLL